MEKKAKVFVGIPAYGDKVNPSLIEAMLGASPKGQLFHIQSSALSLLPHNFNVLYCNALNARAKGFTHFCLVHADVVIKTKAWLDKMLDIMERENADVLSVISPIKDKRGVTSTAVCNGTWQANKLTMREIMALSETFTHPKLLVNTAVILIDIQKPFAELAHFEFRDRIRWSNSEQKFMPEVWPEDWGYSEMAREKGARVFATREIELEHIGTHRYSNQFAWGTEA